MQVTQMKSFLRWFRSFPFFPLLFGLYPVLALYANNAGEVSVDVLPRPFGFRLDWLWCYFWQRVWHCVAGIALLCL
jgi:hypothetical protein